MKNVHYVLFYIFTLTNVALSFSAYAIDNFPNTVLGGRRSCKIGFSVPDEYKHKARAIAICNEIESHPVKEQSPSGIGVQESKLSDSPISLLFGHQPGIKNKVLSTDNIEWNVINGNGFNVFYTSDVKLKTVINRLNQRTLNDDIGQQKILSSRQAVRIISRLARLRGKVKNILGLNHINIKDLNIIIFKDRAELSLEVGHILASKENSANSFYIYKCNTICTSEDLISDSVIGHEFCHAIVDHYFSALPPTEIAEALAQFTDASLDREDEAPEK